MGKQRRERPVPAYFEKLPEVKKSGTVTEKLRSFAEREKERTKKRKALLELFRNDFESTGNPLSAWDAYLEARYLGEPVPNWVLRYLDGAGKRLMQAKNTPADLARCLGFLPGAGPGPWQQYKSLQMRRTALGHILRRAKESPAVSIDDLCVEAAEKVWERWRVEIEWDTIKRWYYEKQ